MPPYMCSDSLAPPTLPILLLLMFYNVMSSFLLDEDVCVNHHSHKRQIEPPEKDVGGCVGLLYQFPLRYQSHLAWPRFHCGASEIYHNPTERTRKRV